MQLMSQLLTPRESVWRRSKMHVTTEKKSPLHTEVLPYFDTIMFIVSRQVRHIITDENHQLKLLKLETAPDQRSQSDVWQSYRNRYREVCGCQVRSHLPFDTPVKTFLQIY